MNVCLFLSNSNYVLMQNIRVIAKKYKIDFVPCKYIFEILERDDNSYVAVLVDDLNLLKNLSVNKNFYYLEGSRIISLNSNQKFDTIEQFFESNVFKLRNTDTKSCDDNSIVDKKILELGIVFNTWQSRFLKTIILDMKNSKTSIIDKKFIETEQVKYNLTNKNLICSLRPLIKQVAYGLEIVGYKTKNRIYDIINCLYLYIFEKIG